MPVTDPLADLLTRIRNAIMARHETVSVPSSNLKTAVTEILKQEGFIEGYEVVRQGAPQPTRAPGSPGRCQKWDDSFS